jgi:pyruvate formate lyase activating enzyme
VNPEIPLHVSRFFPCWKMTDRNPTPVETVYRLAEVARENLQYVYVGNC